MPPEFWQTEVMADALASGDLALKQLGRRLAHCDAPQAADFREALAAA